MKLPCEITAQWILPFVRITIAKYLSSRGLNQKEIANFLNVSQPVVCGYLKDKKQLKGELIPLQSIIDQIVKKIKDQMKMDSDVSAVELLPIICSVCKNSRISGPMCTYHRIIQKDLPQECSICITTESGHAIHGEKVKLQQRLITAAKKIFISKEIFEFIPEIGSQFAALYTNSSNDLTELDVLTFPGRIIKYKDNAKIVALPEFGISSFTAKLLLNIYQLNSQVRCVLILKNTKKLYQKISNSGRFVIKDTKAVDYGWDDLLDSLKPFDFNIICDTGASGYESLSYFFSDSPESMIDILSLLLQ